MLASVNETASAWTMVEVNVEHLVRLRERAKEAFLATHGVKLTYLPFVVRATVDALKAYPPVNSRIEGDDVVTPRAVHMGIAVSYDAGLIVPVIHNADVMNSVGIARAVADLAARARAHQLKPDEVQGATFTITNPGPYGSLVERADHQPAERWHPLARRHPTPTRRGGRRCDSGPQHGLHLDVMGPPPDRRRDRDPLHGTGEEEPRELGLR